MKVFISQPMRGRSQNAIRMEREKLIEIVRELFDSEIRVVDSLIDPLKKPRNANPIWFLGKSIELMATADVAVFAKGWQEHRGCKIEHDCALEYGLKIIEL